MGFQLRGHPIYFDGEWRYLDNDEPTVDGWKNRDCGKCKKPNRPDGHDACLGVLPNVINACCGHGSIKEAYVQFEDKSIQRGEKALRHFENVSRGTN